MDNFIFEFLTNLRKNNNREWFKQHKSNYDKARKEVEAFIDEEILPELSIVDPKLQNVSAKQCIFRIYRDVRFSKNKLPYKTAFGVFIGPAGRKSPTGYYLHIEPGKSFAGGGSYRPGPSVLKAIRSEIYFRPDAFKAILNNAAFKNIFGEIRGERLIRPPKGFPAAFPEIDLLKLKDFTVLHSISDDEIVRPDFGREVLNWFRHMKGLNDFIYQAIENIEN